MSSWKCRCVTFQPNGSVMSRFHQNNIMECPSCRWIQGKSITNNERRHILVPSFVEITPAAAPAITATAVITATAAVAADQGKCTNRAAHEKWAIQRNQHVVITPLERPPSVTSHKRKPVCDSCHKLRLIRTAKEQYEMQQPEPIVEPAPKLVTHMEVNNTDSEPRQPTVTIRFM